MAIIKGAFNGLNLKVRGEEFCVSFEDIQKFRPTSCFIHEMQEKFIFDQDYTLLDDKKVLIYINKNAQMFENILDYFEYGELHLPKHTCIFTLEKELKYWGFEPDDLSLCCLNRLLKAKEDRESSKQISKQWMKTNQTEFSVNWTNGKVFKNKQSISHDSKNETSLANINDDTIPDIKNINRTNKSNLKYVLSKIFLEPTSCLGAKVWSYFMLLVIIMSVLNIMIETIPALRWPHITYFVNTTNYTKGNGLYKFYMTHSLPAEWIFWVDVVCTAILTVDFVARMALSPNKKAFLKSFLTVTDLLGLTMVWIMVFLVIQLYLDQTSIEYLHTPILFLAYFRIVRLARFGHIINQYRTLRVISVTLRRSWKEFGILLMILVIFSSFFGIVMFLVEIETQDTFLSMFESQWWAVITMSTVGYGDFYPVSDGGRFVGVMCAVSGIVLIAMATTVLVQNFTTTVETVEQIERVGRYIGTKPETISQCKIEPLTSSDETCVDVNKDENIQ